MNAVLLRPLPFANPDRLVMIHGVARTFRGIDQHDSISFPNFADWRDQARTLEGAGAYATRQITVAAGAESRLVRGKLVSPSLFGVLGVEPALGRSFRPEEEQPGRPGVVILSDGFWKQQLGGDPNVLGRTLTIMEAPFTVVGVMPAGFHIEIAEREQLYAPLTIDPNRNHDFLQVIGRMRAGVSLAQTQADLGEVAARLSRIYPRGSDGVGTNIVPLIEAVAGPGRLALLILFAVVVLVLLIACTNVASLLLARGASRQRELAVRAALGAGRGRLARQLLVESLVIAIAGGAAGLLVAEFLARGLVHLVGTVVPVPRLDATRTDVWALAFTTIVSLATGIAGVVPALLSASPDLNDRRLASPADRPPEARAPRSVAASSWRVETALALVLLPAPASRCADAGDHAGDAARLRCQQPARRGSCGYRRRALDNSTAAQFFEAALTRVRALPGVRAAAFVADLPLNGSSNTESFHLVGRPDPAPGRAFNAGFNIASAGYFHAMGIPIREGRDFLDSDGTGAPGVIVVNQTAARRFWPDRSALSQEIDFPSLGRRRCA
jgi:predicted permease